MAYWKFVCSWETERECLIRKLAGSFERETEDGEPLDVEKGDTIFLHRTTGPNEGTGYLLGPFIAASDASEDIVPQAWNHKARFRWQVRFDWEDTVYSLNVGDLYDGSDDPSVRLTADPQVFSEVSGLFLAGQLRDSDPIISPP